MRAGRRSPRISISKPRAVRRQFLRHVALRERAVDVVRVAARSDPADHLAVVPDRLVAEHVGVGRIDDEGHAPQLAAVLLLARRRLAADEVVLLQVDEAAGVGLEGAVDRAKLAEPGRPVLLQPHGEERAHAEIDDAEFLARLHDLVVEPPLIFRLHPDLVAEVAGIGDAVDHHRNVGEMRLAEIEEAEGLARDVLVGELCEHFSRVRPGDRRPTRSMPSGLIDTEPSCGRCRSNQRI